MIAAAPGMTRDADATAAMPRLASLLCGEANTAELPWHANDERTGACGLHSSRGRLLPEAAAGLHRAANRYEAAPHAAL